MGCSQRGCFCNCEDCRKRGIHNHSNHGTGCHNGCVASPATGGIGGSKPGSAGRSPGSHRPKGRGSRGGSQYKKCKPCNGSGYVHLTRPPRQVICDACNGVGQVPK